MNISVGTSFRSLAKTFGLGTGPASIAERLARGSAWSFVGALAFRLLILVSMVFLARIVGQKRFGEFGLIYATLGVAGIFAGVGLGGTATRFIAAYVEDDKKRAGRAIALVTSSSLITISIVSALLVLFSGEITVGIMHAPHLQNPLLVGIALLAATALRGVQNGIFAGFEKFEAIAKLNIVEGGASFIGVLLLSAPMGISGALLSLSLGAGIALVIGGAQLRQLLRSANVSVRYRGSLAEWPMLGTYSLPSFLAGAITTPVLWWAMTLVARSDKGFSDLALYNAAYQWHGPLMFLPVILMSVSMPILVQEWESGRVSRFRQLIWAICGVLIVVSLPAVLVISVTSPWLMGLYGREFAPGYIILILLTAAAPFHGLAKIGSAALLGMRRAWRVVAANLTWAAVIVFVSLWLIPTRGASGLAIAFLAAYVILAALSLGMASLSASAAARNELSSNCQASNNGSLTR